MKLLQLRQKFRELSGRFDLVNEDGSDNGADFFIHEGQKYLDRLDETQKSQASYFRLINIGGSATYFPYCRAVREVWAMTTSARWQLEKKPLYELIQDYLSGPPSERNRGTPLYYSPGISRYIPEDSRASDFEAFAAWVEIPSGNAQIYNTILLNVPTSEKLAIEIKGLFYSIELSNDDDENYWSANHPLLLISAAMMYVESVNRNTQGVNDWANTIHMQIKQLGMDFVEEDIAGVTQMQG